MTPGTTRALACATLCGSSLIGAIAASQSPAPAPPEPLAILEQEAFRNALASITPTMVRIETIGGAQPVQSDDGVAPPRASAGFRQADGPTTGVIWTDDGYIVSSSFNFVRDPSIITVRLSDGRRFVARLIARDRPARLALLKIDAAGLPLPQRSDPGRWRPGQWALAAGYGHGSDTPAVAVGVISAVRRMSGMALQTDARLSPANYGGPLFDVDGRLMGVCVPMGPVEDELADAGFYDSGVGFAIRAELIDERLPKLKLGRDLQRGLLGVALDTRDPVVGGDLPEEAPSSRPASRPAATSSAATTAPASVPGVLISDPPRGPAAEAGLRVGDVITRIDGVPTPRLVELRRILFRLTPGDEVDVSVDRNGESLTVRIRLAAADDFRQPPASRPEPGR